MDELEQGRDRGFEAIVKCAIAQGSELECDSDGRPSYSNCQVQHDTHDACLDLRDCLTVHLCDSYSQTAVSFCFFGEPSEGDFCYCECSQHPRASVVTLSSSVTLSLSVTGCWRRSPKLTGWRLHIECPLRRTETLRRPPSHGPCLCLQRDL